ncbi:transposase [candidate division KSB1 bacterium]|nr:transposase [candidate division KSB1 bacterium]
MAYAATHAQVALFDEPDDYVLDNNPDVTFTKVFNKFEFNLFLDEENLYYKALADFNRKLVKKAKERKHQEKQTNKPTNKDDVYQELLFEILDKEPSKKTILFKIPSIDLTDVDKIHHNPKGAGRKPKDFYGLVKAFLGVSYMRLKNSPDVVHSQLINNPSFARKCGFEYIIDEETKHSQHNIPSLRKLEHFDQIMNLYGIWDKMKWKIVNQNLTDGTVEIEKDLAFDPSHVEGNSGFKVVETVNEKGKKVKRAVGKLSKRCTCVDKENCEHDWEVTDHGCAVVVKAQNKKYWAHKASFVGFPKSHVPIDAAAVNYAAANDGKTLKPHWKRLVKHVPFVTKKIERVIADGPFNTQKNKDFVRDEIGATLYAPINPKNISVPSAKNIKGIKHFTKNGIPVCDAGLALEMKGRELTRQRYIWGAPIITSKNKRLVACSHCLLKKDCCPNSQGRTLRTKASDFPQIDWDNPQHLSRWKSHYSKRTAIERIIKTIKVDYCAEHFSKRDSLNFQGHLDKTMLALHVLLSL